MARRRTIWTIAFLSLPTFAWAEPRDSQRAVVEQIDKAFAERWQANRIRPSLAADDAEFLRRMSIDLIGRIPTSAEVYSFLTEKSTDKRDRRIDELLSSPAHAKHMANVWRAMMLPKNNNPQVEVVIPKLELWLRQAFLKNAPYDQMVREVITTSVVDAGTALPSTKAASPIAFFQANELKAENLAAATSRVFLGIKIECAQCHNHPFAPWRQTQFWEFAAFYSGIQPQQVQDGVFSPAKDDPKKRSIVGPGGKTSEARFLDKSDPRWDNERTTRESLASWITSPHNPYFAQATVNKVWAYFLGTGLIDPVDEPEGNAPSHPGVFKLLCETFVKSGYDLRSLFRVIVSTRAYQLSSIRSDETQDAPREFARMAPRGMSPEQLFDSLAQATGFVDETPAAQRGVPGVRTVRNEFLAKFASQSERRTEPHMSIVQALSLMNGEFVEEATSITKSRSLAALVELPGLSTAQRVEALFVATLSRLPRPEETTRYVKYVEQGGPSGDKKHALADVVWVLLNTSEFCLNN